MEYRFQFCQNSGHSLKSSHHHFRDTYFLNILMKLKLRQCNSKIKKGEKKTKLQLQFKKKTNVRVKGK